MTNMPELNAILNDIDAATERLMKALSGKSEADFNMKLSEDRWSAGEIAEHLLILETAVNKAFPKAHDTERSADGKITGVRAALEDEERRYVSPEFIRPSQSPKNKEQIMAALKAQRELLKQQVSVMNLSQALDYRHPVIGSMTRLEWIYFIIAHSDRHRRQMERIAQSS